MNTTPLELIRQIGEHKWAYGIDFLNEHPEMDQVLIQKINDWSYTLKRNCDNTFTRLTTNEKITKSWCQLHN